MSSIDRTKNEVLLEMKDIVKEFPGVKALNHVSLTVKKGTVHALMGKTVPENPH